MTTPAGKQYRMITGSNRRAQMKTTKKRGTTKVARTRTKKKGDKRKGWPFAKSAICHRQIRKRFRWGGKHRHCLLQEITASEKIAESSPLTISDISSSAIEHANTTLLRSENKNNNNLPQSRRKYNYKYKIKIKWKIFMMHNLSGCAISQGGQSMVNWRMKGDGAEFLYQYRSSLPYTFFFAFHLYNFLSLKNPNITETVYYVPGCVDPTPVRRTLYGHVLCTDVDNIPTYCRSRCFAKNVDYNFLSYSFIHQNGLFILFVLSTSFLNSNCINSVD